MFHCVVLDSTAGPLLKTNKQIGSPDKQQQDIIPTQIVTRVGIYGNFLQDIGTGAGGMPRNYYALIKCSLVKHKMSCTFEIYTHTYKYCIFKYFYTTLFKLF